MQPTVESQYSSLKCWVTFSQATLFSGFISLLTTDQKQDKGLNSVTPSARHGASDGSEGAVTAGEGSILFKRIYFLMIHLNVPPFVEFSLRLSTEIIRRDYPPDNLMAGLTPHRPRHVEGTLFRATLQVGRRAPKARTRRFAPRADTRSSAPSVRPFAVSVCGVGTQVCKFPRTQYQCQYRRSVSPPPQPPPPPPLRAHAQRDGECDVCAPQQLFLCARIAH